MVAPQGHSSRIPSPCNHPRIKMPTVQSVRPILSRAWDFTRTIMFVSYPEARAGLRTLPKKERLHIIRSASKDASQHWQTRLGFAVMAFSCFLLPIVFLHGWNKTACLIFLPIFLLGDVIHAASRTHFKWTNLTKLFPGRCTHCGYDLRATPTRCPECGTEP